MNSGTAEYYNGTEWVLFSGSPIPGEPLYYMGRYQDEKRFTGFTAAARAQVVDGDYGIQIGAKSGTTNSLYAYTTLPVDVTNYKSIGVILAAYSNSSAKLGVSKSTITSGSMDNEVSIINATNSSAADPQLCTIDVSTLTGSYYLGIRKPGTDSAQTLWANVMGIYMQ